MLYVVVMGRNHAVGVGGIDIVMGRNKKSIGLLGPVESGGNNQPKRHYIQGAIQNSSKIPVHLPYPYPPY